MGIGESDGCVGIEQKLVDDFIICPVRGMTEKEKEFLEKEYIPRLESSGRKVHYPPRDTNQNDKIGLSICSENRAAVRAARKSVDIYYNPTSTGTVFDIGMTFMAGKPVNIINPGIISRGTDDLGNFILKSSINACHLKEYESTFYDKMLARKEEIKRLRAIEYVWYENSKEFLFDFGMAFMAEKPIVLANREFVEAYKTEHKSFQNVLLALDGLHRKRTICMEDKNKKK